MSVRSKLIVAALGAVVAVLAWQNHRLRRSSDSDDGHASAATAGGDRVAEPLAPPTAGAVDRRATGTGGGAGEPAASRPAFSLTARGALAFFQPREGETLLAYRDRILPIAQAAAAPHRRRVAESFDAFAAEASLSATQRAQIDQIVDRAGEAVQDRIMQGVLSGELMPPDVKPSTGVAFARDVLDLMDGATTGVRAVLTPDQLAALEASRFDVVDYLVFSTRWEDMLGVVE